MNSQIDPNTSIVNQYVLHFEVCLERKVFILMSDKYLQKTGFYLFRIFPFIILDEGILKRIASEFVSDHLTTHDDTKP